MTAGKLGVIAVAGALGLLMSACNSEKRSASAWRSVEACYGSHIEIAEGAFSPLNGDRPADLLKYCEWAFARGKSDFSAMVPRTQWLFAVQGPMSQRQARLDKYFAPSR